MASPIATPTPLCLRNHRFLVACLFATLLLVGVSGAHAQTGKSLWQKVRELLGIQRAVAVGGTRGPVKQLCVISPWRTGPSHGDLTTAITPSGAAPIATREPLVEVQIRQGSTQLWRGRGTPLAPLPNPLAWPIAPLRPGESVDLLLRPSGSEGGSFARVLLSRPAESSPVHPSADAIATADVAALMQQHLQSEQPAEAVDLLMRSTVAGNSPLDHQTSQLLREACGP